MFSSSQKEFHSWKWQMSNRKTKLETLKEWFPSFVPSEKELAVSKRYPFSLTPYYASLIETPDSSDPVFRMAIPNAQEMDDSDFLYEDPLGEVEHSPVHGLLHRYPDRVVLLVNGLCPVYCRHCTRKRLVGIEIASVREQQLQDWVSYLKENPSIKEVILSGGDPLTLSDDKLENILQNIRRIPSVEVIRIGTRIPVLMPMRLTDALVEILSKYSPIWVITHFNHPNELSEMAISYLDKLRMKGIPVNNQSVLLRGVNDHADIIESLCRKLVRNCIRPYYLHQCDLIQGIEHLRTPLSKGIEIMEALRGRLGGIAIPQFVVDLPKGGGKVPVLPAYVISSSPTHTVLRNFEGRIVSYPEPRNYESSELLERKERGGVSDLLNGTRREALVPTEGTWKSIKS